MAGHVILENGCILSGNTAVQQRVRVGRLAMLGGTGGTTKDIPPFILQQGYNCVTGLNIVGLRRGGVPSASIDALRQIYRIVYREGRPLPAAIDRVEADFGHVPEALEFTRFLRQTKTGINPARSTERGHFDLA